MLILLTVSVAAPGASAGPAERPPPPGLTLPRGAFAFTLTGELNASAGRPGQPASIAPDVSYGATSDSTISIVHSTFATTGFRGAAGRGLCLTGEADGCPHVYDNVGVEVLHSLRRGPLAIAGLAGLHALALDAGHHGAKLGVRVRASRGQLILATSPAVYLAVTERDGAVAPNLDRYWIPASATVRLGPVLSLGAVTGVKGTVQRFDESYELALGAVAQASLSPRTAIGASWVHGKLVAGTDALPAGTRGRDVRAAQLWVVVTP